MLLTALAPALAAASTAAVAAPNIPRWATTYDWDMTPGQAGTQGFTNLAWGGSLVGLDYAWGNYSRPGMWDFNGNGDGNGTSGCIPNKTIVIGEPYCGGATGLDKTWKVGAQWVVDQVKGRKHIVGLSLGDEPEIWGVPYTQMCELSLFLKSELIAAGRGDIFIHYNDGPGSGTSATVGHLRSRATR